jgi:ABC-2 type transport system permease protein
VSGLANFVMLPMWIFSGVFFSATNFPAVIQPIVQALPLTALVNGMRAIMLQGVGLSGVLPQIAVLVGYLVVCLAVALRVFRWQ